MLYTRWEYNDRGQIFPQALFQMNPDGTGQTEFYGNNSWFPTTILHARDIPGTQKVVAIATGHHSRQMGKLIVIDPARGRQENAGVQLDRPGPRDAGRARRRLRPGRRAVPVSLPAQRDGVPGHLRAVGLGRRASEHGLGCRRCSASTS